MPAAPTLHSSEVQADAEEVEGDHEGELEVDLSVVDQKVEEVVVVRIDELQLVKSFVEDSQVVMGAVEWGWNERCQRLAAPDDRPTQGTFQLEGPYGTGLQHPQIGSDEFPTATHRVLEVVDWV